MVKKKIFNYGKYKHWYEFIELQYKSDNDPELNYDETCFIMSYIDKGFRKKYKFNSEAAKYSLVEKEILHINDHGDINITTKGSELLKSIYLRMYEMPSIYTLGKFLKKLRGFDMSIPKLAKLAGMSPYRLYEIEDKLVMKPEKKRTYIMEMYEYHRNYWLSLQQVESLLEVFSYDKQATYKTLAELRKKEEQVIAYKKRQNLYQNLKIEYYDESDVIKNEEDFEILEMIDKHNCIYDIERYNTDNLMNNQLIDLDIDKNNNKYIRMTEKGKDIFHAIKIRRNYPPLNNIIDYFIMEREKSEMTRKEVAIRSNIEEGTVKSFENREEYAYDINKIKIMFSSIGIDFENVIGNNLSNEVEKSQKKEENCDLKPKYKILVSESPIETKLLKEIIKQDDYEFEIDTQREFTINRRNYRADIYIEMKDNNGNLHKVVVECDGHDYHEKTKEQAKRDKQRDRDFLSKGIMTIRFTGSEIWRNTNKCVQEIFDTSLGFYEAISQ